jgi:hypothetical protein
LQEIKTADDVDALKTLNPLTWLSPSDHDEVKREISTKTDGIIRQEIKSNRVIFASNESTSKYCDMLIKNKADSYVKFVLTERLSVIKNSNRELLGFLDLFSKMNTKISLGGNEVKTLFEAVDSKINLHDNDSSRISTELLRANNECQTGARLITSIHSYAALILNDKRARENFADNFESLRQHDFPSLTDERYVRSFVEAFFNTQPNKREQEYIFNLFIDSSTIMYFTLYVNYLMSDARKNTRWLDQFMGTVTNANLTEKNRGVVDAAIINALKAYSASEAGNLLALFNDDTSQEYLMRLIIQKRKYSVKDINKHLLSPLKNEATIMHIKKELDNMLAEEAEEEQRQKEEKRSNSFFGKFLGGSGRNKK